MAEINTIPEQQVKPARNYDAIAWRWMRYSGFLLIFLAFFHIILQDVLVGPHAISLNYVAARWANVGWRIFDAALLIFAFAHGVNGFRQILADYIHSDRNRAIVAWLLFFFWLAISTVGAIALIGGVQKPA